MIFGPFQRIWESWKKPSTFQGDDLETISECHQRWRSIYISYFTILLTSLGFSVVVAGVWPYLTMLDANADKATMGFTMASYPIGQMLFTPLISYWGKKIKSIRIPMCVTIVLFGLSSAMYLCLNEIPSGTVQYVLVASRFLGGIGSANLAVCKAYIFEAARESEQSRANSMAYIAQVVGYAVGPALQACVTPIGAYGFTIIPGIVVLNMYTAAGWITVALSIVNIVLFLPAIFKEHRIAAKEVIARDGPAPVEDACKDIRIDQLAVWPLLVGFFIGTFNVIIVEIMCTSMAMDLFAWSRAETLQYGGLILSGVAIVSISSFLVLPALQRKFSERNILIFVGFLLMAFGRILYIPFLGGNSPKMAGSYIFAIDSHIMQNFTVNSPDRMELIGCPISQEWCRTTPALPMVQFLSAYALTAFGYPIIFTLLQRIYAQVLGCRPEGVWLGLINGSGSLARVLGPICIGFMYSRYGMYWTYGLTEVTILLSMFWIWIIRHRLKQALKNDSSISDTR